MLNEIVFLDSSRDDLEIGKEFYDEVEYGLGADFVSSILSELSFLKFRFGLHKEEYGFHRIIMKGFPFLTYSKAEAGKRVIVAILDSRGDSSTRRVILESRRGSLVK